MPPEMSDLAGIAERLPWPRIAVGALPRPRTRWRGSMRGCAQARSANGFIARTHFLDGCASLWLEGDLVHLDDVVLHDADQDVRNSTPTLTLSA